jgi:bifunctional DNA-binding transcriptional regulator/antitoxin component of YhaV-PrlF toxin-antitoxin module
MNNTILEVSERGQITIPNKIRKQLAVKRFICRIEGENIVLEPLQTREEFLKELEDIEGEYKKNGGMGMDEIKKKHNIK